MTAGEILLPLIEKSMQAKGYTRDEAARRAFQWMAKELGVPVERLAFLDYEQEWCAQAVVERAMLSPPKKQKKHKYEAVRFAPSPDFLPWTPEQWTALQRVWGTEFYAAFFGEWVDIRVKTDGLLSAGQYAPEVIRQASKIGLFDA